MVTIKLSDGLEGDCSCTGSGGDGGADINATYLLATANAGLPASRVLNVTSGHLTRSTLTTGQLILGLPSLVTAGTYGYPSSVVVDAQGRITSITAGADPSIGMVPGARTVTAGAGMTGGGALTANIVLDVGADDSSITVSASGIKVSTTLQTAISTNTANIATLTTGLATANTNIATNTADIAALQALSSYRTIENPNGTPLTQRSILAFDDTYFAASDATDTTNITAADIPAMSVMANADPNFAGPPTVVQAVTGDGIGQFLVANDDGYGVRWRRIDGPFDIGMATVNPGGVPGLMSAGQATRIYKIEAETTFITTEAETNYAGYRKLEAVAPITSDIVSDGHKWKIGWDPTLIAANTIAFSALAQGSALSVVGVAGSSAGNLASIAGTADQVLRVNSAGTALAFGTIATAGIANNAVTTAKLSTTGVTAASYTNANITVGADGRITAASNGITGGYQTIENPNGTPVTARSIVSFSAAFTATDNVDTTDIDLASAGVAFSKLANGSALSVLGRSANTSGVMASIAASASSDAVLRESGGTLGFGTVATAGLANNAVTDAKLRQGVARSVIGVTGNSTANVADIQGTADQVLRVNSAGTALAFGTVATAGIADAAVSMAKLADLAGLSVIGRSANTTGVPAAITAVTDGHVLRLSGTSVGFGTLAAGAFADTTIAGSKLSGFTNTALPVANSSGQLTSSAITLASNLLTHGASSSGGSVGVLVSNTSNTASSTADLTVKTAGSSAGSPSLTLSVTGVTDWVIASQNGSSGTPLQITRGGTQVMQIDTAGAGCFRFLPGGSTNKQVCISYDNGGFTGPTLESRSGTANSILTLLAGNTALTGSDGYGVGIAVRDNNSASWKYAVRAKNRTGTPLLELIPSGGNIAVGGASVPTSLEGGIVIANGTAASANPSGGGCFEVVAGALYWLGSSGTRTLLANA